MRPQTFPSRVTSRWTSSVLFYIIHLHHCCFLRCVLLKVSVSQQVHSTHPSNVWSIRKTHCSMLHTARTPTPAFSPPLSLARLFLLTLITCASHLLENTFTVLQLPSSLSPQLILKSPTISSKLLLPDCACKGFWGDPYSLWGSAGILTTNRNFLLCPHLCCAGSSHRNSLPELDLAQPRGSRNRPLRCPLKKILGQCCIFKHNGCVLQLRYWLIV